MAENSAEAGGRTQRADAQRNRLRVLEATWRLLKTRGPDQITMEEVAQEAAIGRATLYRHFPTLESLSQALLEHGAGRIALAMRDGIPPEAGAPAKLSALVSLVYDAYEEYGINIVVLLNSWRSAELRGGDARHPAHPISVLLGRMRGILEQGVREGAFRPVDLDYTAVAIFSLIGPFSFVKQRERLGYGRAELEERVIDLLLHALQATGSGQPAGSDACSAHSPRHHLH